MGHERAVAEQRYRAQMVFAKGPARGGRDPRQRAGRILSSCEDALRAVVWAEQVHGRDCAVVGQSTAPSPAGLQCVGRFDALLTRQAAVGLVVWTADCVPLLLAGEGVVAAVHCGWRGCAADLAGGVIERLQADFGVAPGNVRAALGPSICGACYPVGDEVIAALAAIGPDPARWRSGRHVDLRAFLVARLEALGLASANIEPVGPCTATSPELASFRRDGEAAGRQWSMVYLLP